MASRIPTTGHRGRDVSLSLNPMFSKKAQPSFGNSLSNMTRTLLRENKSKNITTYSKKRPIQFVNKAHFLTPDTPDDFIADVFQDKNGSSQVLTMQKQLPQKKHQKLEGGGSYTSSLLQQKTSWQEGSGHSLSATRSTTRGGSSLALRNISNIPIEKTLSTTSCRESHISQSTPGRRQSENPKLLTPHCARKQRLVQMGRSKHKASQRRVKNVVRVASLACKSNDATCNKMMTMSTCTTVDQMSSDVINRCSTAQSVKSMSLCSSTGLTKEGEGTPKERQSDFCSGSMAAQQPANSTFGDGSMHLQFRDTVPQDLSAIGEPCQTEDKDDDDDDDDDDDTLTPEKTRDIPTAEPVSPSNSSHNLDVLCGPTSSTPTDPGKIHPAMLDISEIESDQTEEAVAKKQDVNTEELLVFDPLPLEVSSTVDVHKMANHVPEKDITPESEQEKYSSTATPQHKRCLAYIPTTSDTRELTTCCMLADWPQAKGKKNCVTKCKQMPPQNAGKNQSLPTDVLCLL